MPDWFREFGYFCFAVFIIFGLVIGIGFGVFQTYDGKNLRQLYVDNLELSRLVTYNLDVYETNLKVGQEFKELLKELLEVSSTEEGELKAEIGRLDMEIKRFNRAQSMKAIMDAWELEVIEAWEAE